MLIKTTIGISNTIKSLINNFNSTEVSLQSNNWSPSLEQQQAGMVMGKVNH
jgi:hypothetical protein